MEKLILKSRGSLVAEDWKGKGQRGGETSGATPDKTAKCLEPNWQT